MRIYKPRGLNVDESYACSRRALRECFGEWDISVFWGDPECYAFDRSIKAPPKIDGTIVAAMALNFRKPLHPHAALRFFVIRGAGYDREQQLFFEEQVLPRMHDWLCERREKPPVGGVDELLILWNGSGFATQRIHYM